MKLPQIAVSNYQFIIVILILMLSLGTLSYLNMPRSEDPLMESPFYTIVAVYPGTGPKDMEELIVNPIEEELNEVEDLNEITTQVEDGIAVIQVEAEFSVDVEDKYDELSTLINTVKPDLPEELYSLEVSKFNPLDVIIMQYALTSGTAPYKDLFEQAERLEKVMEQINGIRTVDIQGYPEEQVRIAPDLEKMAALNVSLNQLSGVLQSNHLNIPGGDLEMGDRLFSLKTSGGYKNLSELKETAISSFEGQIVYLKDIAEVYFDYEDPKYVTRFNGTRGLFLSVTQKEGMNILDISERMDAAAVAFQASLPPNIQLEEVFKQAPAVRSRINNFFGNLLQGIALVGIIILLFLGFRTALVVMTVIPASILMAILALDQADFGLQQISIAGLVIALGLLVDNGIVVVENINRFLREGHTLKESVIQGTSEVGWALVSATATTVLAFFPMSQLGGGTGEYLKSLPLIVIFALLASLLLALTVTPLLSSRLFSGKTSSPGITMRGMQWVIDRLYRPVLQFSLRRSWLVTALIVLLLGGSFALFPLVGISFFPTADKPLLLIDIELPQGSSLANTHKAVEYAENILRNIEDVKSYAANIGHGNPQIYYNVIPENYKKNYAQIVAGLEKWESERFYELLDSLRTEFSNYAGAEITVSELKNGPPYEAPIAIRVIGENLDTLKRLTAKVEQLIANTEGSLNIGNPFSNQRTDIHIDVNRDKAAALGLQLANIDMAVRTALTGTEIGTMQSEEGKEYPMIIRLKEDEKGKVGLFPKIQLSSLVNAFIPLRQVARLEFEAAASRIDHFDMERMATVTADVREGFNTREVTLSILEKIKEISFPPGYRIHVAGEYETQQESFGNMGQLLIIAMLGIFAVLILQFRSFIQPLIVLSAIPLAFTGSIGMLYLTGYSFSFFAFVGFTSLIGIVVNSSIILVDYTNQLRAAGMEIREAILKAASTRFTPILLTTLTTITGLLPLTLTNSNLWSPLGWTIIGGMISSTVLTLIMVPILYKWMGGRRSGSVNV
jgi:multidrug efflux pump subunit AcrB